MKKALFLAAAIAATSATAQPFKCTNEEGKTVYSDQRCETMPKKAEPVAAPKPAAGGRYQPTAEEQERIRKLETQAVKGSTSEQKEGAILEVSGIRTGQDARLSAAERAKRDGLGAELANTDPQKRVQALRDLRDFYSRL